MADDEPPDDDASSRRGALIGLLVIVALVLGGMFLYHRLSAVSRLQDCVAAGRSNCAPLDDRR